MYHYRRTTCSEKEPGKLIFVQGDVDDGRLRWETFASPHVPETGKPNDCKECRKSALLHRVVALGNESREIRIIGETHFTFSKLIQGITRDNLLS